MFELIARIVADNVGTRLPLEDNSVLPQRCAICNQSVHLPASRRRIKASAVGAESARITIYVHLCPRHARRRVLVAGAALAVALLCGGLGMSAQPEGKTMPTWSVFAFGGFIADCLVLINSLVHDPYFRGLEMDHGKMEVKGFGKRFVQSLQPDEIQTCSDRV
jgi:hypothetical protein